MLFSVDCDNTSECGRRGVSEYGRGTQLDLLDFEPSGLVGGDPGYPSYGSQLKITWVMLLMWNEQGRFSGRPDREVALVLHRVVDW